MVDYEKEQAFDLRDLLCVLLNRLVWILLTAVIVAVGAFAYSRFFATPMYRSSTTMYIYNDSGSDRYTKQQVTYNELYAAQSLADPYQIVLTSDSVLSKAIEKVGLNCTPAALRKNLSTSVADGTVVISLSVNNKDPEQAQKIANAITEVFPQEIRRVVKAGGVEIIDKPNLPVAPYSPNVTRNTLLGAVVGFILAYALFLVLELTNTVIRDDEDVQKEFSLPLLGSIPRIDVADAEVTKNETAQK